MCWAGELVGPLFKEVVEAQWTLVVWDGDVKRLYVHGEDQRIANRQGVGGQ